MPGGRDQRKTSVHRTVNDTVETGAAHPHMEWQAETHLARPGTAGTGRIFMHTLEVKAMAAKTDAHTVTLSPPTFQTWRK